MKSTVVFVFVVFVASGFAQEAHGPRITDSEVKDGTYLGYKYVHVIPSNLNQCLLALSCSSPQTLNRFTDYSLSTALKEGLNNQNNRIRMNWKLELESSPLTQYFYHQKVFHHETMETIILWCLYEDLNGKDFKVKQIIRKAKRKHRVQEKNEKKRLKTAFKTYKKAVKNNADHSSKEKERIIPPRNFEEWIFTY